MANLSSLYRSFFLILAAMLSPFIAVGQSTIWSENFDSYSDGTTTGNDNNPPAGDDWTSGGCSCGDSEDWWEVQSGVMEARDVDSKVWWESEDIDISSCSNVQFSLDATETGDMESSDYFDVFYRLDGGAWNQVANLTGNWTSQTISQTGLSGTTLELKVELENSAGSEYMDFDNVLVEGNCCSHSISSFSPSEGCPDTGTVTVTINGSGFNNGTGTSDVQFGGVSASSFSVISDSEIEAEVPVDALDGSIKVTTDGCDVSSSSTFDVSCALCHDIFVNEFSNGESGQEEYVELIVGNSCGECHVDLNGWIIDDNNGDFSGGANTGEGIAPGHVRFDPNGDWENIPTGSIILIYNSADENYTIKNEPVDDDPTDSNNDSVYVIPISNSGLQECTSAPDGSNNDDSYSGCSYSSPASWSPISMANDGDAMQVRKPDGSYFHGTSYGDGSNNIDGGPDGLQVSSSGGADHCYYFSGTDAMTVGDWTVGDATNDLSTTDETPASANNSTNATEIEEMRLGCSTLPIQLLDFSGSTLENGNQIHWRTVSELHHDRFELQRSRDAKTFHSIRTVEGKGAQGSVSGYRVLDEEPPQLAYYRLKSVDLDGSIAFSRTIVLRRKADKKGLEVRRIGNGYRASFPSASSAAKVRIYSATGKKVKTLDASGTSQLRFRMDGMSKGLYFLQYRTQRGQPRTRKFFH